MAVLFYGIITLNISPVDSSNQWMVISYVINDTFIRECSTMHTKTFALAVTLSTNDNDETKKEGHS